MIDELLSFQGALLVEIFFFNFSSFVFFNFFVHFLDFIQLSVDQETERKHTRLLDHEMIVFIYCISLQFDSASSLTQSRKHKRNCLK